GGAGWSSYPSFRVGTKWRRRIPARSAVTGVGTLAATEGGGALAGRFFAARPMASELRMTIVGVVTIQLVGVDRSADRRRPGRTHNASFRGGTKWRRRIPARSAVTG